jgi:hypothetical protein
MRSKLGLEPILRPMGRPPQRLVECTRPGCGAVVSASAFAKHMRTHDE